MPRQESRTETSSTSSLTHSSHRKTKGRVGRTILFFFAGGGIALSILTALSCDFFTLDYDENHDPSPFYVGTTGIGLFSYKTMNSFSDCIYYESLFFPISFNKFFRSAQVACLVAPCLAILGLFMNSMELFCCRFYGSVTLPFAMYLLACIAQACTFLLYGQTRFCLLNDDMKCQLTDGAMYSMAAGGAYYICTILMCCVPRPYPCFCQNSVATTIDDDDVPDKAEIVLEAKTTFDLEDGNTSGNEDQNGISRSSPRSPRSPRIRFDPNLSP